MKSLSSIVKSGFILTADKFKLFIVVTCSTLLLIQTVEFIFKKVDPQNQVLWLLGVILIENFLTCGVYGSLKKILSGTRFSGEMFLLNAISFFIRFLLIKLIFITSFFILGGLGLLIAEATGKIPIFAAAGIVLILLVWLAFPAYYFVLSLFAPIVLFSQNTGLIQSFKTAIYFLSLIHI